MKTTKETIKKVAQYAIPCFLLAALLGGCKNGDPVFDDFDYTTTYFPYQYPVRTLILGESDIDNSNDLNHQFLISATMGGVYENTKNINVEFEVDESLVENLVFSGTTTPVLALPTSYYSLSSETSIVIPSGSYSGGVTVQLNDNFFEDTLSYSTNYVIPVTILSSTTDSVLVGSESVEGANIHDATQWDVSPKNFTLFGIKYINEYHGSYLLRGKVVVNDLTTNTVVDTITYSEDYVEQDIVTSVSTIGLQKCSYTQAVRVPSGESSPGDFTTTITVDDNYNCVLTTGSDSPFEVSGTGTYSKGTETWGGKDRNAFYLAFDITIDDRKYSVCDTLVFRDNTVSVEEFEVDIITEETE